jgi:hypothetical protein
VVRNRPLSLRCSPHPESVQLGQTDGEMRLALGREMKEPVD